MFGANVKAYVNIVIDHDPAADEIYPVWRAPQACEVVAAYATVHNDVAANSTAYFDAALQNGSTAGTAVTALAGTIGGTGGWTGLLPKTFTISQGTLAAGETVNVKLNENTIGTFGVINIQLEVVMGLGAN